MEKSGFFNSLGGDRVYDAGDFAAFYGDLFTNGVFYESDMSLKVTPSGAMAVNVAAGSAWINGYRYFNTSTMTLALFPSSASYSRIDRIVLRWSLLDRSIRLAVLKGEDSTAPVPMELSRTPDVWEICLADVSVPVGSGIVQETSILDTRLNPSLCGSSKTRTYLTYGEADTEALLGTVGTLMSRLTALEQGSLSLPSSIYAFTSSTLTFSYHTPNNASGGLVYVTQTVSNSRFKASGQVVLCSGPYGMGVQSVANGSCTVGIYFEAGPGSSINGNTYTRTGVARFVLLG